MSSETNADVDDGTEDELTDAPVTSAPTPIDFERVIETELDAGRDEGSHTERDPSTFHPSSVGYSDWMLYVNKLGLKTKPDTELLGTFEMGNLIHEYVQDAIVDHNLLDISDAQIEVPVDFSEDGLRFKGHADLFDPDQGIVYDIKSRSSWYHFDTPVDRHVDQLHCYMRGLNAQYGKVIYVSKKDMEVRTFPEDPVPFNFDTERWNDEIKPRCQRIREAVIDSGIATEESEIPFERPDNYFCNNTDLDFSGVGQ